MNATAGHRVLLHRGSVYSPAHPQASALCVQDGHVVWVGDDDTAAGLRDGADTVVDLDGGLVTPAFVDAHAHLAQTGQAMLGLDLSGATSLAAALDALAGFARRRTGLLLGFGWDDTRWPEGRAFTGTEVDRAVGDRPAYLARVDAHSAVLSGALVARMPEVRGLDGWSGDGTVHRAAHHHARAAVQTMAGADDDRRESLRTALAAAARQGIGAVHELGGPHLSLPEDFAVLDGLPDTPHVLGYWGALGGVAAAADLGCAGAAGDLCADGAIGSRTAALLAPYADADTRGHRYLDAAEVRDHVLACTRAGLQAGFHCIGDDASATVLDGFRAAAGDVGRPAMVRARHRLEHVEMVSADDIATMADLGVVASVQPMFDRWWGGPDGLYERRLGARHRGMNPYASMARAGVPLAFGSDTPVTPFDPWGAVLAAAFHHNPDERLSVRAAFGAHTRGGWRAARHDDGGVLAPGSPATLAVWDVPGELTVQTPDARVAAWSTDPRAGVPVLPALHPDADLPVCRRTYVDGRLIFDREGAVR